MSNISQFLSQIESRFDFLKGAVVAKRPGRVAFTLAEDKNFDEVLNFCVKDGGFSSLLAITGLDEIENFAVIYHLFSSKDGILNLKRNVNRANPVIQTVTDRFFQADVYERELVDLLGIEVRGLPPGSRYPLSDNWPKGQYPLRKDWKCETSAGLQGGAQ